MNRLAPWLAAVLGLAAVLAVFWPGYMSWDSAYQWWQARNDQFDSVHPPLMAMIWQLSDRVVPGPAGMFALQAALLWSALAMFAAALPVRPAWRFAIVLGLGFWPPLLAMLPHVWKDLWTLAGFAWALALLAHDVRAPHRGWRAGALLALTFACAFRHNAITGALPLVAWIGWCEAASARWLPRRGSVGGTVVFTVAMMATVMMVSGLPNYDSRVRHTERVWSVVTLWDAAAVSLAEGALVYPPGLADESLTLDELRGKFVDFSNTSVYETGKLRHSFDGPYTPAQREALEALAWSLPRDHAPAYFAHRWRLTQLLLGWDRAGLPDGLVMMPGLHQYNDNPPVAPQASALHARTLDLLRSLIDTPLFAGWIYLVACVAVIGVAAVALARRPRHAPGRASVNASLVLAAAVAASALAYALPLTLASGSAEFRYLAWPVLATLASVLLLVLDRLKQ
ncbi:MAG: hypothetical protein K0M70_10285 [Arenimonas sp.]|uniref:hypothetical protein n=1 Tax=Arenimonas sp. TaxID=1872635 RepID=UPI0025BD5E31|nr:hypothetical protein [Arenimonas sp.]MBW8368233.1 hypothetical protein [Arenimonas sp.]